MDKVKTARILKLLEQARLLPTKPGCYLMKNEAEQIIYIGKAKSLKARVQSYFQQGPKGAKTEMMVSHVRSFEFVMTETEAEALVLENTLIKQNGPKYNIRLKDDKSYPYVVVDHGEPFPTLQYLRRVKRSPDREIFGPFVLGSQISQVIKVLTKSFQLRDCSLHEFRSRKEPCLLYQMHQCSAPCVGKITPEQYEQDLNLALGPLRGKGKETLQAMESRMHEASEQLHFELAAQLRDHLQLLNQFLEVEHQRHAEFTNDDHQLDVLAFYESDEGIDIALCMIRHGLMLGHKNFSFSREDVLEEASDFITRFVLEYYSSTHDSLPEFLVLSKDQLNDESYTVLDQALKVQGLIRIKRPGSSLRSLVELTFRQAHENQRYRLSQEEGIQLASLKLQELLGLASKPKRLECYDVAILQGSSPTAAQIVFEQGKPLRESYRHFSLEERPEGNNDYAMMREILARRLKHGELPDLFFVDGGVGQVNVFLAVLRDHGIDLPVVGIAKSKTRSSGEERLIIPGRSNPYFLSKCPPLMKILLQMRDESHRFSRRLHHRKEQKRLIRSWLDEVSGIGPKTREKILKIKGITQAEARGYSVEDFCRTFGLSKKIARALYDHLHTQREEA
jgi:excinuclease ABC subunit C